MKIQYAILYKRELVNEERGIYILKPCSVISGYYNEKNRKFYDTAKEERYLCDDTELYNSNDEYCVGSTLTGEQLLEEYPEAKTIDDAKIAFNEEIKNSIHFSIYDMVNETVTISNRPFESLLEAELANDGTSIYETIRNQSGLEISVFSAEEFTNMLKAEEVTDIIEIVDEKITNKKSSLDLLKNKTQSVLIIPDVKLIDITNNYSLFEIKQILESLYKEDNISYEEDVLKQFDDDFDEYEDDDDFFYCDDFIETYKKFKENIMKSNNMKNIKDIIKKFRLVCEDMLDYQDNYEDIIRTTNLDPDYSVVVEFFKKQVDGLEKLLKITDKEELKKEFVSLFNKSQGLLHQMQVLLPYDDDELEDEIEIEEINTANKEDKNKKIEYKFDYKEVHDKMVSRIINRDEQIDRILTTIMKNDRLQNKSKRSAMIIAGTTGTGKTQTYVELKKALAGIRPVVVVDTNQLTQEGYVGGTIEDSILSALVEEAHSINIKKQGKSAYNYDDDDIELARHGIVILDEIDKRSNAADNGSVNTTAVINQLLKLMDPINSYQVKAGRTSVTFDTSELTIFASGAFQEYFDQNEKKKTNTLGFVNSTSKNDKNNFEKYNEVDPIALVKYGLDRQFIGRFNNVTLFSPHTLETLIELEKNKTTSNLQVEIDEYKSMNVSFVWEEGFIEALAKKAYEMKTGGRALSNLLSRSLGSLNVEVNNRKNYFKAIYVPISALEDSGTVSLLTKDNEIVTLKDLVIESQIKNKELRKTNDISMDQKVYKLMKKKCKTDK